MVEVVIDKNRADVLCMYLKAINVDYKKRNTKNDTKLKFSTKNEQEYLEIHLFINRLNWIH